MLFSQDWFSHNIENFKDLTSRLDKRAAFLEIGCFEGRATCWLMQNALSDDGIITVIDTFEGGEEHDALNINKRNLLNIFEHNISISKKKGQTLEVIVNKSTKGLSALMENRENFYDFIYVDGSHIAPDVLTDACMAFPLLKPGGIMLFDDYVWTGAEGELHRPKMAIDAFHSIFNERAKLIHIGYQIAYQKI